MTSTPPKQEAGIALLLALLAMTIVGGMAYRTMLYAHTYRSTSRTFKLSIATQQQLRRSLDISPSPQRACRAQRVSMPGRATQDWYICSRGTQPFITNHPITLPAGRIDYNTLFLATSRCPGQIYQAPNQLTRTPSSGSTCELPLQLTQGLTLLENIRCQNITFERQPSNTTLIITTAGSLLCDGVLTVPSSSLIVAGGDIRIASVASKASEPISVTIISAHGDIVVGSVSGAISLLTIGRNVLSAPPTQASDTYLLPPFTQSALSGIKPAD